MKNLFLFLALSFAYFTFNSFNCTMGEVGSGNLITKELKGLTDFDGVASGVSAEVELIKGDTYKVVYEGDDNFLDKLKIEVQDNSLNIESRNDNWNWSSRSKVKFTITMPTVRKVALGGSGNIYSDSNFNTDEIKIALGGSGNVSLKGKARIQEVAIGGSGDVDLSDMEGEKGEIAIGGSGNVKINVSERLSVAIAGSGDVLYKGEPRIKESVVGSGEVKRMR